MILDLNEVNRRVRQDAAGFVQECEAEYAKKIDDAARTIASRIDSSPIILLSGPSGSGKTTSALKLQKALEAYGVGTKSISMDDYFKTVCHETAPRNEKGELDYESPYCMDIPLLKKHMGMLIRGEEIEVPKFIFSEQRRSEAVTPMKLSKNQAVIFEGIHALNDMFDDAAGEHETKLYISARSNFCLDGEVVFKGTWTRLMRRIVRDDKFRGTRAEFTLSIWDGIRNGEKKYISPFKNKADIIINSTHPYEICMLKAHIAKAMPYIPEDIPRRREVLSIPPALERFEDMSDSLVPEASLLREFIGGGNFNY